MKRSERIDEIVQQLMDAYPHGLSRDEAKVVAGRLISPAETFSPETYPATKIKFFDSNDDGFHLPICDDGTGRPLTEEELREVERRYNSWTQVYLLVTRAWGEATVWKAAKVQDSGSPLAIKPNFRITIGRAIQILTPYPTEPRATVVEQEDQQPTAPSALMPELRDPREVPLIEFNGSEFLMSDGERRALTARNSHPLYRDGEIYSETGISPDCVREAARRMWSRAAGNDPREAEE